MKVELKKQFYPAQRVDVADFADASRKVQQFITKHTLGAGLSDSPNALLAFEGGAVLQNGVKVAAVSYNGRVFSADGNTLLMERA